MNNTPNENRKACSTNVSCILVVNGTFALSGPDTHLHRVVIEIRWNYPDFFYPGHPRATSWGWIITWNPQNIAETPFLGPRRYDWVSVQELPSDFMSTSVLSLDLLVGSWTWRKIAKSEAEASFPVGSCPYFQCEHILCTDVGVSKYRKKTFIAILGSFHLRVDQNPWLFAL